MKLYNYLALPAACMVCGCAADHSGIGSNFPPGFKPVPLVIIHDLPNRIQKLPVVKSMRGSEFLGALGLKDYASNITGSVRHSAFTMVLDSRHTLEFACDPDSLKLRDSDFDHLLNSGPTPPGGSRWNGFGCLVVSCSMSDNDDGPSILRQLPNP